MSGCVRATDTVVSAYRNSYMQVAGEPTRYVLMVHGDGFRHSRGDESGRNGERMLYHTAPDHHRTGTGAGAGAGTSGTQRVHRMQRPVRCRILCALQCNLQRGPGHVT